MVFVVVGAFLVHVSRIPIALTRHSLGAPVGPDAELGVAEPVRTAILLERFPGRLERAVCDRKLRFLGGARPTSAEQHNT